MMKVVFALAALLGVASAFTAMPRTRAPTRSVLAMSHFSKIQTELKDEKTLVSALKDLNIPVIVAEGVTQTVRGYKGDTVEAQMVIPQNNGMDIGFAYDGNSYEMVSDLAYWDQEVSVERFMQKLKHQYSVNTVLTQGETEGFKVNEKVVNKVDGSVEITLTRWAL